MLVDQRSAVSTASMKLVMVMGLVKQASHPSPRIVSASHLIANADKATTGIDFSSAYALID